MSEKSEILLGIDLMPDDDLPIRILEAYREQCNCLWATQGLNPAATLLYEEMNKHQQSRLVILDKAISKLKAQ